MPVASKFTTKACFSSFLKLGLSLVNLSISPNHTSFESTFIISYNKMPGSTLHTWQKMWPKFWCGSKVIWVVTCQLLRWSRCGCRSHWIGSRKWGQSERDYTKEFPWWVWFLLKGGTMWEGWYWAGLVGCRWIWYLALTIMIVYDSQH